MTELPRGWIDATLGDICHACYGQAAPREDSGAVPVVASAGVIRNTVAPLVNPPVLVIGRKGAVGRVQLFAHPIWPTDTTFFIELPAGITPRFMSYQLQHLHLEQLDRSTAVPSLQRQDLESVRVMVAPAREQERIVASIEGAFSRIHAGLSALGRLQTDLKRVRTSVIHAGITGRLCAQDPAEEPGSQLVERIVREKLRIGRPGGTKPGKRAQIALTLPDGWTCAEWQAITLKIGDVDHKMPTSADGGVPYVSPRDFLPNNGIDYQGAKRISPADYQRLSSKIRPEVGDLIFPRYGTIGENRLVVDDQPFLVSYSCALVKTMRGFIDPRYQYYYSISPIARDQARAAINDTTQANVGLRSIQEFLVPVPPLAEQQRIANEIERLLSRIDALDTLLAACLQRAGAMRSAILAKAFSGDLVMQDPADESASVLVAHIRDGRGVDNRRKSTRGRRPPRRVLA